MVRGGDLDVSEMAVVTHLLAHRFGKPITGIAIPLWSRLPHVNLVCTPDSDMTGPKATRRPDCLGVRAYAQTSGVWVRGILQHDYGVDLDTIRWLTMEDAHLTEYDDPPISARATPPRGACASSCSTANWLRSWASASSIPSGIRTVIPDAEGAAHNWIERNGHGAINHILSVKTALVEAARLAGGGACPHVQRGARDRHWRRRRGAAGIRPGQASRASLQMCLDFSAEQQITPRRYAVDEMFVSV